MDSVRPKHGRVYCNAATMAAHRHYLEPSIQAPKRHTPWFVWLMCGFALTVVASLIYGIASMTVGGVPKLGVERPETPSHPAAPPSPGPATPDAR